MTKLICIYILICTSCLTHKASAQSADSKAYKKAYEYILRDPMNRNKTFVISDSVVHLYKPMFWRYLKSENETDSIARIRVDSLHYAEKYLPTYSPLLKTLSDERLPSSSADYIIYFSKISDDRVFLAEVLSKTNDSAQYSKHTIHNKGTIYLMFLDEKQSIRRAIKRPMRYVYVSAEDNLKSADDSISKQNSPLIF